MLSPWKKSCDQCRQHIKKKRHYFPDKDLDSQSYGFSNSYVWIWELDRKKAEHWRIDAFELWCQRKLLRVPWTARKSNQSFPKEISSGYSLEGLVQNLKLQYFGHLMWRAHSFEETLMLGKIEGRRRRVWQRMRWFDDITDSMHMRTSSRRLWRTGKSGILAVHGVGHDWAIKQHQLWGNRKYPHLSDLK